MPKNHFKLQAIAFACCLAFGSSGRAQDRMSIQKRALIDDLLRVNRTEQYMQESMTMALGLMEKTMTEMISKSIPDQLDDKAASKEAREQAAEITSKRMAGVHEMMMEQINVPELIEQVVVPLYDKYYTENELKDLIAFYKTPTGEKLITVQPQLTAEAMSNTMQYMLPKMEAITKQLSEEMLNELKKNQDGHKSKK